MMKFNDWFNKNLIVGRYPDDDFQYSIFDYVINVSDEFRPSEQTMCYVSKTHFLWFPMNEGKRDVGLNSIYGACCVLNHCEKKNFTVYLHCHAGINRSQAVRAAYHYMRTGHHFQNPHGNYLNSLIAMCHRGYLPPKAEMEKFLKQVGAGIENGNYKGLDMYKVNTINNF